MDYIIILILLALVVNWAYSTFPIRENPFLNIPIDQPIKDWKLSLFLQQKHSYITSEEWSKKRKEVLKRDFYRCQVCGEKHNLHVHHMDGYMLIPNEPIDMLVTLCASCHQKEHTKHGYPQTLEEYKEWKHYIKD